MGRKYTAGPWVVHPTGGAQHGFTIADVDDNWKVIAENPSEAGNARLIASAPEMIQELVSLRKLLKIEGYQNTAKLDDLITTAGVT